MPKAWFLSMELCKPSSPKINNIHHEHNSWQALPVPFEYPCGLGSYSHGTPGSQHCGAKGFVEDPSPKVVEKGLEPRCRLPSPGLNPLAS